MSEHRKEIDRKLAILIAKTWSDEAFKERLRTNAREVLKEEGFDIPDEVEIEVYFAKPNKCNIYIPQKPSDIQDIEHLEERRAAHSDLACDCNATYE
jgi:hypothetical protein